MAKTPDKTAEKAKAERLAAALRENLKRRKAQARGRIGNPRAEAGDSADKTDAADEGLPPKP